MSYEWSKECLDRTMWSSECYVEYEFCCDIDDVTKKLKEVQKKFPYLLWGTHIHKKLLDEEANIFYIVIRRFITKEECLRHSTIEEIAQHI